jgi:hypothetical protein
MILSHIREDLMLARHNISSKGIALSKTTSTSLLSPFDFTVIYNFLTSALFSFSYILLYPI